MDMVLVLLLSKRGQSFRTADIKFGNLECVLSTSGRNRLLLPSCWMRGEEKAVNGLKSAGLNLLSVANNHIMQHGEKAFMDTIDLLRSKGIKAVGVKDLASNATIPVIIDQNDIKIGFLGYSLRPEEYKKDDDISYANADEIEIMNDILALKGRVDQVVLSIHWGDEFMPRPSPDQIKMAHRWINCGATLIIGHHPHVLQGMEKYGDGIIAYSLGNFIFDMWTEDTKRSMALSVSFSKDKIERYSFIPVKINDEYQPEILTMEDAERAAQDILYLDKLILKGQGNERSEQKDYESELKTHFAGFRESVKKYYLKNLFRYNFFYLLQNIIIIIIRRITGRHI